ncbi:MAG: T9SS type A sorting domain-containing protein [Bacteroidota bacterium]
MKKKLLVSIMFSVLIGLSANAQWQPIGPGGGIVKCFAKGGSNIYAATFGGGVFLTTDNGTSWINKNNGLTNTDVQALAVTNAGATIFAGTYGGGVFLSTDNGDNWTAVNTGLPADSGHQVQAVAIKGTKVFAGTNAGVFVSINNGGLWAPVNTGLGINNDVLCLAVSGADLFAGTGSGGVFRSPDDGANWTVKNTGLPTSPTKTVNALAVNGTKLYAGVDGGVYSSTDIGNNWTSSHPTPGFLVKSIDVNIDGTTIYAGYGSMTNGGIARSANNGGVWGTVSTGLPAGKGIYAVLQSVGIVFAGTDGKGLYTTVNNGGNWIFDDGITSTNAQSLSLATTPTNVFAGVYGGGVYRSTNNSGPWTPINTGLPTTNLINTLATNGSTAVFVGTELNGVYRSTDNGANWTAMNTGLGNMNVTSFAMNGTYIYAGTFGGGVFRAPIGGGTWVAVNTGITGLKQILSLVASGTKVFAGAFYGDGLFYSNDNGNNWIIANDGLTNKYVNSLALSGNRLFAGTGGGVFSSPDNGDNWLDMNNGLPPPPNLPVAKSLFISGYNIFLGTDGGGVFLSNDSANHWTAINTNLGNFNVWGLAQSGAYIFGGTKGGGVWKRPMSDFDMTITTQSANVTACGATDSYFSVAATGIYMTYQWQVSYGNGFPFNDCFDGGPSFDYSGVNTNTLTILGPNAWTKNGFQYHCVITSGVPVNSTLATLTIIETPNLVVSDTTTCSPNTINITTSSTFHDQSTSNGTVTYWTNSDATMVLSAPENISVSGTYFIKKAAGTCFDIKPVVVTINTTPNLSVTNPSGVCSPNTVNITGTFTDLSTSMGTVTYWTDAPATLPLAAPNLVNTTGTYYIKKAAGTCIDIKPVVVTINALPNLSVTNPSAICSPATIDIQNSFTDLNTTTGAITYWADAGATISLTTPGALDSSGTYYIQKIATGGCTDIKPVIVTIDTTPDLSVIDPAGICFPGTVDITSSFSDLNGSTGTVSYWTDINASIPLSAPNAVTTSGIYYIKKSVIAGCLDIEPVNVIIRQLPVVTYTQTPLIVCDNHSPLTLTGGSPAGGTFSGTGVTANVFDPAVAGSGTFTIVYTYSDVFTCTETASQSILVDLCTGIEAKAGSKEALVSVFPNPFITSITLSGIENSADVVMYNVLGAQVGSWRIINAATTLQTDNIPAGVYFLHIKTGSGTLIKKIIKE